MYENYRYPGEFEKVSDVFLSWIPHEFDYIGSDSRKTCVEIVKALVGHAQIHINCGTEGIIDDCRNRLKEGGIDLNQIIFTQFADTNFFVRDNGPNFMVDDAGGRIAVNPNWSYYGVRDTNSEFAKTARRAGVHMAVSLDCYDIVNSDIVSEGGDREFNGVGVMMCIDKTEVKERNPKYTKQQVEDEYKRIYNLKKVIWLPMPLFEDDDFRAGPVESKNGVRYYTPSFASHIDEMCRFVGRSKVLLAEVTAEESEQSRVHRFDKTRLDESYEILSRETDGEGNPLEIVRMPVAELMPFVLKPEDPIYALFKGFIDDQGGKFWDLSTWPEGPMNFYIAASYCNFLICNDVVIAQKYYRDGMDLKIKEKDEKAAKILQECFPDRRIITIDTFDLNMLAGGIHCWTKEAGSAVR